MPLVTEGASIAAGGFAGVSLIYLTRAVIVRRANRLTAPGIHITARPTAPPTIGDAQSPGLLTQWSPLLGGLMV